MSWKENNEFGISIAFIYKGSVLYEIKTKLEFEISIAFIYKGSVLYKMKKKLTH